MYKIRHYLWHGNKGIMYVQRGERALYSQQRPEKSFKKRMCNAASRTGIRTAPEEFSTYFLLSTELLIGDNIRLPAFTHGSRCQATMAHENIAAIDDVEKSLLISSCFTTAQ